MHVVSVQPEDVFQALADPIRIRIIRLLFVADEEACLCEFVDSLQEAQYKLSKHVKYLKHAGLLSASKDGRWIYHKLVDKSGLLKQLYDFIQMLPDDQGTFASDLRRFRVRLRLRKSGRCRIGIQTPHFAADGDSDEVNRSNVSREKSSKRKA